MRTEQPNGFTSYKTSAGFAIYPRLGSIAVIYLGGGSGGAGGSVVNGDDWCWAREEPDHVSQGAWKARVGCNW
jgi:hypothetical protein